MRPAARLSGPLLAAAGIACLFCFPPAANGLYPPCWFHQATGLLCPGCGATRALAELLHGHMTAAFGLNPLFVLLLPGVLLYLLLALKRNAWPEPPRGSIAALLTLAAVFTVWRNL